MSFDTSRVCFAVPRVSLDPGPRRRKLAKGYWIARVDGNDTAYLQANAERLRKYGGKFLVHSGTSHGPEGGRRTRNIVVEFPSYQTAYDCWHAPEYQSRAPLAEADVIIIEAYEGPQP